jgi:transposase InsO family protein
MGDVLLGADHSLVPWKETSPMEERMQFVSRLRDGERITDLCREFGISRKTAHKFVTRYKQHGVNGLMDRRRIATTIRNRTQPETVELILKLRREQTTWGPKKLRKVLLTRNPNVQLPVVSTIGDILQRHGLVAVRRRKRHQAPRMPARLSNPQKANELWCIDYKGQFRMGNGRYCYPLTITDAATRYILACEGFERISGDDVRIVMERLFEEVGLPGAIRYDGGAPFASTGLLRLSAISAWWMSLGIRLEQIDPASPQQNGRHERMHRTLKAETTRPAAQRLLQQQERFDKFVETFNCIRPHEALDMQPPAKLFVPSKRAYKPPIAMQYPLDDLVLRVTRCGHVAFPNSRRGDKKFYLSASLGGYHIGARELADGRWRLQFCDAELGHIDRVSQVFVPTHVDPVSAGAEKPRRRQRRSK